MSGLHTDASGEFLARLLGAFVLGWSPLLWWARDQTATPLGLAITRSNAILDTIATVLSVAACLRGVMNGAGWTIVAIFVVFGSVRLYFGFIAPVSAPHPAGSAH